MSLFEPNEGGRPSRLDLDRFATGELVGDERQTVQAWLFGGNERFAHLENLRFAKQSVPKLDLLALRARAAALAPDADVTPAEEPPPDLDMSIVGPLPGDVGSPGTALAEQIVAGTYETLPPAPTPGAVERRATDPFADRAASRADANTERRAPDRHHPAIDALTPEPQVAVRTPPPRSSGTTRATQMPRNAAVPPTAPAPTGPAANRPWWIAVPFALAATIALLVGVGQLANPEVGTTEVSPGVVFRAGDKLAAFVVSGDTRAGYDGRALGAGDVLAFQAIPGAAAGAVLLSIDGTGTVTVFEPATGDVPTPVGPAQGPVALPATVVLDGAPGPEVFVVAFDQPASAIRDGAGAAWRTGGPGAVARWAEANGGDTVVVNRK